ncbi:hypothetical protein QHH03_13755 [Aphanizomenon sp. 202]|nr:hypothetical protein [Aphanizomenon sp. 202]
MDKANCLQQRFAIAFSQEFGRAMFTKGEANCLQQRIAIADGD